MNVGVDRDRGRRTTCTTGNVSLRTRAGSIIDALNDAAADVLGQTIDIDANGGSIGQVANDLEIDSSRSSVELRLHRRRARRDRPTTSRSRRATTST